MSGIRAEIRLDDPPNCPIATISRETGSDSHSISRSVGRDGGVTEEFVVDGEGSPEEVDLGSDLTNVFAYGDQAVYRLTRDPGDPCPCERIEAFDCPIVDIYTDAGSLFLAFHVPDIEELQAVIGAFEEHTSSLNVERLLRSQADSTEQDLVFVDRSELTDRQREVLEVAHDRGYFDHPKGANAGEIAAELDITTSTFTEHLAAAQRKILGAVLDVPARRS